MCIRDSYGAYKTITLSVLAFILITGCVLLYLNPGNHQLMMELLMFQMCIRDREKEVRY